MLRISIDRIDDLLDQASDVQLELDFDADEAAATAAEVAELAEVLADDPAYLRFVETLATLTTEEVYELLALSLLARNDAAADEWESILEETRSLPEESLRDELKRALLLSDEIETALERLGFTAADEDDEGDEDLDDEEGDDAEAQEEAEQ
jgi:hypothetical protein